MKSKFWPGAPIQAFVLVLTVKLIPYSPVVLSYSLPSCPKQLNFVHHQIPQDIFKKTIPCIVKNCLAAPFLLKGHFVPYFLCFNIL